MLEVVRDIAPVLAKATAAIGEYTSRALAGRYGSALRALVSTGSLARNEATFVRDGQHWKALGDADFFVVFHQGRALPPDSDMAALGREVERALAADGLIVEIGLAAVNPSYFRALPPHIATYELRSCGRVVWGDPEILGLIPAYAAADISREDAWRMLANRMSELLEAMASEECCDSVVYRAVKLFLDMATSYLVFAGRYEPAYRDRERALTRLADAPPASAPFPLREFADRLTACTEFKLGGRPIQDADTALQEQAIRFAHELWRWELMQLTGAGGELSDRELLLRWMRLQPLRARLHGWASVLRRCGWLRSWRHWLRWARLARRASPRYWVYGVAADLLFSVDPDPADWRQLACTLPLAEASPQQATRTWRCLAEQTACNYRRFLEATRA